MFDVYPSAIKHGNVQFLFQMISHYSNTKPSLFYPIATFDYLRAQQISKLSTGPWDKGNIYVEETCISRLERYTFSMVFR